VKQLKKENCIIVLVISVTITVLVLLLLLVLVGFGYTPSLIWDYPILRHIKRVTNMRGVPLIP